MTTGSPVICSIAPQFVATDGQAGGDEQRGGKIRMGHELECIPDVHSFEQDGSRWIGRSTVWTGRSLDCRARVGDPDLVARRRRHAHVTPGLGRPVRALRIGVRSRGASPAEEAQVPDSGKAAKVARRHGVVQEHRRGGDLQVVSTDRRAPAAQVCGNRRVHAGHVEAEGDRRQGGEPSFNERFAARALDALQSMHAVKQLRRGDGGDGHGLAAAILQMGFEVEVAAFAGNEHA